MKRGEPSGPGTLTTSFSGALLAMGFAVFPVFSQEAFLEYAFDDEAELSDFFVAESTIGCGPNLLMGSASVEDGALVLTNGAGGASVVTLLPVVVEDFFPEIRDYRVRMRVNFETHSGLFYVFVRTRMGIVEAFNVIDITDELGYPVYLDVINQDLGVIEESNCNIPVAHPEWPGNGTWALAEPGFAIETGKPWYWMEITVSGDDDGGPIELTAKFWIDGEVPPEAPQFTWRTSTGSLTPTRPGSLRRMCSSSSSTSSGSRARRCGSTTSRSPSSNLAVPVDSFAATATATARSAA